MAKVHLDATMPDFMLKWFLQMIRKWEAGRSDIEVRILVEAPKMTVRQVDQLIHQISPHLPIILKIDESA